jgi:mutual gliding-motility protein MglA
VSTINFAAREINCKIVYYGPGVAGKTTNLKWIYGQVPDTVKGEMVSLATEDERTLFFDFLPIDLGTVQGFKTRFHLYTVPGQVFYNASRKLILRGVDGIIFVADSAPNRLRANAESMRNLRENLHAMPVDMLRAVVDPSGQFQCYEGAAQSGVGVFETLRAVSKLVLERLAKSK